MVKNVRIALDCFKMSRFLVERNNAYMKGKEMFAHIKQYLPLAQKLFDKSLYTDSSLLLRNFIKYLKISTNRR